MLVIIPAPSHTASPYACFARFVDTLSSGGERGYEVFLTEGQSVWKSEQPVRADSRPASRIQESPDVFMEKVSHAFTGASSVYKLEALPSPGGVQGGFLTLLVKEAIAGTTTMTILVKVTLIPWISPSQSSPLLGLLQLMGQTMSGLQASVCQKEEALRQNQLTINSLLRDMERLTTEAEKLQEEMVRKMCLVVNAKKQEVLRLKGLLEGGGGGGAGEVVEAPPPSPPPAPAATVKKIVSRAKVGARSKTPLSALPRPVKRGRVAISKADEDDDLEEAEQEMEMERAGSLGGKRLSVKKEKEAAGCFSANTQSLPDLDEVEWKEKHEVEVSRPLFTSATAISTTACTTTSSSSSTAWSERSTASPPAKQAGANPSADPDSPSLVPASSSSMVTGVSDVPGVGAPKWKKKSQMFFEEDSDDDSTF
eukprot:gene9535-10539_t